MSRKQNENMFTYAIVIGSFLLLQCMVHSTAIPQPDKTHGIDHLAHANHLQNPTHDTQYDHEQFLGGDQAKSFDLLAPEESRRRLG